MSILSKPNGGGGGGITPEQLEQLVSDGELSASSAALLSAIAALPTPPTGADLIAVQTALDSRIVQTSDWTADRINDARVYLTDVIYAQSPSTELKLLLGNHNSPPSGWTQMSGIAITPERMFSQSRILLAGSATVTTPHGAVGVLGNQIYDVSSAGARIFNVDTNAATAIAHPLAGYIPDGGVHFSNGKGYVFRLSQVGGTGGSNNVRVYTPETNTWAGAAGLPGGLSRHTVAVAQLPNGKFLVAGGASSNHYSGSVTATSLHNDVWWYDPSTNTFEVKSAAPLRFAARITQVLSDGRVVISCSATSDGTTLTSVSRMFYLYDYTTDTWTPLDSIPAEVDLQTATYYATTNGKLAWLPTAVPATGSRARLLDPNAAPGSQWANLDADYPANCYSRTGQKLANGMVPFAITTSNLLGYYLPHGETLPQTWTALYYARKN